MNKLNEKLDNFVNEIVENDKSVKNAIFAISSSNGDFDWAGAAGLAEEKEKEPMKVSTPYFIASITKMFTATVVMKLHEEKKITLDDTIDNFLPENLINGIHIYKEKEYTKTITIKHLLSHSSGIADYFLDKTKDGTNFFNKILTEPEKEYTVEQTIEIARDKLKPHFEPGRKTRYSDTNYQLLGKIIEKITKKKLHQVYENYLFKPFNLNDTWLFTKSKSLSKNKNPVAEFYFKNQVVSNNKPLETSWADGGLISTTDDCLNFLKALFTGKIIDKNNTLSLMHNWQKMQFPLQYGFGTMYIDMPIFMTMFIKYPAVIGHLGSTGAFLLYAKELDYYLTGTINQASNQSKSLRTAFKLLNILKKHS